MRPRLKSKQGKKSEGNQQEDWERRKGRGRRGKKGGRERRRTEQRPSVEVRRQIRAVSRQSSISRETRHVGRLHDVLEVRSKVAAETERKRQSQLDARRELGEERIEEEGRNARDVGVNVDLVLPLELGPHTPELSLVAVSGLDVVHDVDVNVVEHDRRRNLADSLSVVDDVSKDDSGLRRRDLDGRFDGVEGVRTEGVGCWTFDEFEVSEGGELDREVLEGFRGLVDDENL